ncbi:MAG TPA: hypothetical protein VJ761_00880 [Ktedonobacteraceae bacterium]|nr:hypothetical protein [Ktedonobacteraceae bacterium]
MNAQGYITIVGRLKEMVICGGENIFPREIEEFLLRHPAIAEVILRNSKPFPSPRKMYNREQAKEDTMPIVLRQKGLPL